MIVIDASVAVKWLFVEENTDRARLLLRTARAENEPLLAPALLHSEVTNTIRQRIRRGLLTLAEGREDLRRFLAMQIDIEAPSDLFDRALEIAVTYGLPAAYDAHYIALAQLIGAQLWTADARLLHVLGGALPFVHDLAQYPAAGA